MDEKELLKKSMTKKQLKETMKKNRSDVALDCKMGTISFKSEKDYDRNREKEKIREDIRNEL